MLIRTRSLLLLLSLCLAAASPALSPARARAASPEEIGRVISVTPTSRVERQGKQTDLTLKAPVYAADAVSTDASGTVQILLADDTTVTVAPGTRLELAEFAYDDVQANFAMRLTSGVSRVVTGMIVKKKPDGFKVITRYSTIGIRGTDVSIIATAKDTTVVLNKIHENSVIVTNNRTGQVSQITASGMAVTSTPSGNTPPRPATNEEMTVATQSMRGRGGAAAASSGQEQGQESGRQDGQSGETAAAGTQADTASGTARADAGEDSAFAGAPVPETLPAASTTPDGPLLDPLANVSGSYAGALKGGAWAGHFTFNVRLDSGRVSDAGMWMNDGQSGASATGGSGAIGKDASFSVDQWGALGNMSDPRLNGRFDNGDLADVTWQAVVNGNDVKGSGFDFSHGSDLLNPSRMSPYAISGRYSGGLDDAGVTRGSFGFSVGLGSGKIDDAHMDFDEVAGGPLSVLGGTGAIGSDLGFSITDWDYSGAGGTSNAGLAGKFEGPDGHLSDVTWQLDSQNGSPVGGMKHYEGTGTNLQKQ